MSWYKDPNPVPVGYWGPITSTLLWCEEKYQWSYYVAEPINTVTNLFSSLLPFMATMQRDANASRSAMVSATSA